MLDLYFAGQVTDHVDKCLFDMGANHLFSYLNERKILIDGLAGLINTVEKVNYLLTVVLLLHGLKVHILMLMIMFTFKRQSAVY